MVFIFSRSRLFISSWSMRLVKGSRFGFQKRYQKDKCFYLNVKKLLALALVPISDVIKAFELITNDLHDDDGGKLLDYFEPTGLDEPMRRGTGRKKGELPIELWNVYDPTSRL